VEIETLQDGLAMGAKDCIGALVWWTIRKGTYNVQTLRQAAIDAGLGAYVIDRIAGRNGPSAFIKATQTGARGIKILTGQDREAKVITRDVSKARDYLRALMYQETDTGAWETKDIVTGITAAVLQYSSVAQGKIAVEYARWSQGDQRIIEVVDKMRRDLVDLIGTVDDAKVRSIVIGWLDGLFRVSVRGTGGVYFIPAPADKAGRERLQRKLMAMREWLGSIGSPFSIVAFSRQGALSIDDFVEDAVTALEEDLGDIAQKFTEWASNHKMNAGSVMFSSQTQIDRLAAIKAKIETLKGSLGERIGIVDTMFEMVERRARGLLEKSTKEVDATKADRQARKVQEREAKRAVKRNGQAGKKAGTAAARAKKRAVA